MSHFNDHFVGRKINCDLLTFHIKKAYLISIYFYGLTNESMTLLGSVQYMYLHSVSECGRAPLPCQWLLNLTISCTL